MANPTNASRGPKGRFWTRTLAIELAIVLATPVALGAGLGFFEINPVEGELLAPVGSEAHLLLSSFPDDTLVVEIAYQDTLGPPPGASLAILLARINETCQKASVNVDEHSFATPASSFSESDLLSLEQQNRQHWPTPGTMSLFYLYLNGGYGPDAQTIGLAYRGSSIAVFGGVINTNAGPTGATAVTSTVMVHEFGHDLGLVGIVGSAPNQDPAHPYHSADPNDVMYWAVDSLAIVGGVNSPPTQFGAADLADLHTVQATPILYEVLPWVVLGVAVLIAVALLVGARRRARHPPSD